MPKKYPWDDWFAEDRFVIKKGEHFRCSLTSMAQMVRSEASARKLPISIIEKNQELIVMVAHPQEEICQP